MKLGAGRLERCRGVTGSCCFRECEETITRVPRRDDFNACCRGSRRNRRDHPEILGGLLGLARAVALHRFAGRRVRSVHHAAHHGDARRFAGHAPSERRERKRQHSQHNEDGLSASHDEELSTARANEHNYSLPQNAKVTAPMRNRNETAWFHFARSPRYTQAKATNTHSVITSWMIFSWNAVNSP